MNEKQRQNARCRKSENEVPHPSLRPIPLDDNLEHVRIENGQIHHDQRNEDILCEDLQSFRVLEPVADRSHVLRHSAQEEPGVEYADEEPPQLNVSTAGDIHREQLIDREQDRKSTRLNSSHSS